MRDPEATRARALSTARDPARRTGGGSPGRLQGGATGPGRRGQHDGGAREEERRTERDRLGAPPPVLQVDHPHAAGLLDAHHGADPPGLDVLDHQAGLGLHLAGATTTGGPPVAGQDIGAVTIVHASIVDLALDIPECQVRARAAATTHDQDGRDALMSEERRLSVLRAIVQDYVQTSEPVGSKALLERHQLGVSAATVRNDMAVLEGEGLIQAPHTSAGRIPTDAGYRLFVDRLSSVKPMSQAERTAISAFLRGAVDLDDVVDRTVRLLASLTRQVAVVQYPSLTRSTVRHIELVPMGSTHLMIVLIVNTGRVEQRVVDTERMLTDGQGEALVASLRSRINEVAAGVPFTAAASRLRRLVDESDESDRASFEAVVSALGDALVEEREERVV